MVRAYFKGERFVRDSMTTDIDMMVLLENAKNSKTLV